MRNEAKRRTSTLRSVSVMPGKIRTRCNFVCSLSLTYIRQSGDNCGELVSLGSCFSQSNSRRIARVAEVFLRSHCLQTGLGAECRYRTCARGLLRGDPNQWRRALVQRGVGSVCAKPRHARTGSDGYFLKRGSVLLFSHSQNSLPFADWIERAYAHVAHSPTRARRSRSRATARLSSASRWDWRAARCDGSPRP
jgi:hypothetical protein